MTQRPDADWWEFDVSEKPVPLTGRPSQNHESGSEVADEAESIVRLARDDLAREDMDPTGWATDLRRSPRAGVEISRQAAAFLALACIGMFRLGWMQGITAREPARSHVQKSSDQVRPGVKSTTRQRGSNGSTGEQRIPRNEAAKEVRTR